MSWLKFVESAGNHILALDPDLLDQLKPFYGKTFRIEITEPSFTIDLRACPDGFIIDSANEEISPEVCLRGSLWAFARLAKEGSDSEVFDQGRITISGDAELGQDFQRVLSELNIDWAAISAKFVGEMAAENIHRVFDEVRAWISESSEQFKQNTGQLIQQDLNLAPTQEEVESLYDETETLRSDVARLEARLAQLKETLPESDTKDA